MTTKSTQLGEMIRQAREARGWSVRRLAEVAGINASTISRIETGGTISSVPDVLQAVAEALELPAEKLFKAAGFAIPVALPAMKVYLRAKYGISEDVAAELNDYFKTRIERERGGGRGKHPR